MEQGKQQLSNVNYAGIPFVSPRLAMKYGAIKMDIKESPHYQIFSMEQRTLYINTAVAPSNIIYLLPIRDSQKAR